MSYRDYVIAAYCVFAVVLLWAFIAPHVAIRQQLRAARLCAARKPGNPRNTEVPLVRE